jgi:hypothetical protein
MLFGQNGSSENCSAYLQQNNEGNLMTFRRSLLSAAAGITLVMGAMSSGSALAQEQAPTMNTQGDAQAASSFDDATLDSFAAAFLKVNQLGQTYGAQLQAAKTPEEQQKIQTQANAEMQAAVESTDGIDVDTYNRIIQVAQADPKLAERINQKLNAGKPAAAPDAASPAPAPDAAAPAAQ